MWALLLLQLLPPRGQQARQITVQMVMFDFMIGLQRSNRSRLLTCLREFARQPLVSQFSVLASI